jgi:hypothetical protein
VSNGFYDQGGRWIPQGPPPASVRGYREQMAWLERERPSVPGAEHALSQRLATLSPDGYNEGGHQATRDYITWQRASCTT